MKLKSLVLGMGLMSLYSYSAEKPKVAHMHVAKHGGKVLMLGDVHFEVTGDEKMLMIYYYDRFGDELATSKIKVNLELVEGTKRSNLAAVSDKKVTNLVHVQLPQGVDKNTSELFIKAQNIDMPKGQVVGATLVKVAIKSVGTVAGDESHADHKM